MTSGPVALRDELDPATDVTVLDLIDRVLDKGVVLSGDIVLAVAGIDLVYVGLRAVVTSVEAASRRGGAST